MCYFFFFQAEDGIRDLTVTGVQTCALPIYHRLDLIEVAAGPGARPDKTAAAEAASVLRRAGDGPVWLLDAAGSELSSERSEERRVGKECRCRWWRYE